MKFQLRTIAAAVALLFASSSFTRAMDITFDFSTLADRQSSYTLTSGAYSLLISNPVNSGLNVTGFFTTDSDGIFLGSAGFTPPFNAGFSMQVTGGPLDFKNYVIGFINPGTVGSFSLTGGTGTSTGNVLDPVGSYNFNGSYRITPGDTVALNASIQSGTLSQIKSITFSTVTVPEPSTYALAAIATGVMAYLARRRKQANKTA
jgi:hypothetical protein